MTPLIIACSVASFVFIVVQFVLPKLLISFQEYGNRTSNMTASSLINLFIFVDPKKIIFGLIVIWLLLLLLFWAASENLIFALLISASTAAVPHILLKFLKQHRMSQFLRELPDAILGIANMMKAGSNLTMAMEAMVAETKGPIAQEFGLFMRELRMGVVFDTALDNLYARMPLQELQLVIAGMKISREVGGSLAEVLARLADTIRRKLEMEGKIKSLTAQGKLQGVVMSALPLLVGYVLYQIEPAAMGHLFTDYWGWLVCGVIICGEYIGYRWIKKIVAIDV
jgi:tight adherence protein B